ncbi:UDP-4-amino-4,6-dideoxy-N-acetyl-beta-L-altrosamine transaminase [Fluoribacter gormanii]|uniref:UDP-4-amino-4,6-dideoxy-N-acetyl-beta-L-altrosamine transaminase n=1 Tax=Fluoribacter gormanii TaxID=464 RepID=A0A377GFN8_9GAMM|nr:UDP-4-amino-4,6-dideoxy-N-acetyl-beta-L-altrosamine transaminase [Fluoribacter gormanii]KTD04611.1 AHBA synthase [Fluoribacter gormanii]MCW8470261.1 UDP-4-amino-4,6-dideoxy-N-acetyl-beta-L-altrosamine transaminase [Fluoribacter gormanii]SIR33576.1 UDP-4-amino-4,6-dideoxy-N-acetyl-beta-L-altrosamine transaminase [Fluoribacter gormanii]STO23383.1 UDP-4-amino-4-deoxy-L-arabinose--oxoglutarate aminotransferase [Fluoribacter gormanii]
MIPYGRQNITQDDIDAVVEVLKSDYLTQGPAVSIFEKEISNYCGAEYAIALNSATSALHLACLALDLRPGDWLWTSPITFVASANCALYCGAQVDFIDIDPNTYNISIHALEKKLIQAELDGCLPKILVPVHFSGQPCEMETIYRLSQRYGFKIIEDASHAIGGRYKNEAIGNCHYSDITIFSFHPVKIITTGEGGMVLTNNPAYAEYINLLRSHGITRDESKMTQQPDGPWYYQQLNLGFNYRMTDIQAALGFSQMQRLEQFIMQRHTLAARYNQSLDGLPLICPFQDANSYSSWHLYVIRLQLDRIKLTHRQVFDALRQNNIGVNLHYIPVYRQPYYQKMGFKKEHFPEAEAYYSEAISLPIFSSMTLEQHDTVIDALQRILNE